MRSPTRSVLPLAPDEVAQLLCLARPIEHDLLHSLKPPLHALEELIEPLIEQVPVCTHGRSPPRWQREAAFLVRQTIIV